MGTLRDGHFPLPIYFRVTMDNNEDVIRELRLAPSSTSLCKFIFIGFQTPSSPLNRTLNYPPGPLLIL